MVWITLLLFILFIGSLFMDAEYKAFTKILFGAFLIFLFINIASNYIRKGEKIKQQELILLKEREDQKQDSLLIVLEAKIDDCIIKKTDYP